MNASGILEGNPECIDKVLAAMNKGKVADGHSPGITGEKLAGYLAAGISTDHECGNIDEMKERLRNGMYVQLRYGAAAEDLPNLVKGVTEANARRCVLCTDDLHPEVLLKRGDIDAGLRACVANGIDPITAVQMATLNAAECYRMNDRGAIAPGRRADIVLVEDLKDFSVKKVFIKGELAAEDGKYLPETGHQDIGPVTNIMNVKDFTPEKLKLGLKSGKVHVIGVHPGSLVTDDIVTDVDIDADGELIFDPVKNIARISVIERHKGTGNVANALIAGYGIQKGAMALSIGHDSHNILAVGVDSEEMYFAVSQLIKQEGGIVLAEGGKVLEKLELPVAGLMSALSAEEVAIRLEKIHKCARGLGVSEDVEPVMTLCFMALPTIPELKLTNKGLFRVSIQDFIPLEAGVNENLPH